ncbi:Acetylornithine aminotransferase [Corynebacterium diphtheriae subsp. lausannense]|uniref:daptide-type RiPP biosynthesis aminotransferase n=1 Tax=Corynebacterium belfantii TaxID=2014537 RepID=UPI000DC1EC2D|nr:daptide-type RiPP biosynthesis aminotransferase [Corynebacterium belfantii]MBG9311184.1 aminotransferase class III-fold pyridoxal phosphate-dependent enzyme [Corynebacterium belfantii]MBG9331509.1 aminotransferase class III-fold pyridoxal phosphate-dependent enzyme [Corynebacterium belfantii]SPJ41935.1 Acetylornithine aminotransferase [Corynebacterium diphtheriae subsp. lausannense]
MTANPSSALLANLLAPVDRNRPEHIAMSAQGHHVTYEDGSVKLCATSGLWNVPLGYGNRNIADAIHRAAIDASYLSTFRAEHTYARQAADALVTFSGLDNAYTRVYFSTSGASANDLAMKIIRIYQLVNGNTNKANIVSLHDSYHGLSFGAFALTGQDLGQAMYGVDQRNIRHVRVNDVNQLRQLFDIEGERIGGIILEPVLGNGCQVIEPDFLRAVFALRSRYGFLIIADEVATGFWRTGVDFASNQWEEKPDVLLLSKALTNGTLAASAILLSKNTSEVLDTVTIAHGETQAGSPIVSAAILATLRELSAFETDTRVKQLEIKLTSALETLRESNELITEIGGVGAMRSISCVTPNGHPLNGEQVQRLVRLIKTEGVIVYPGVSGIQVFPAYTYTTTDLEFMTEQIDAGLEAFSQTFQDESKLKGVSNASH